MGSVDNLKYGVKLFEFGNHLCLYNAYVAARMGRLGAWSQNVSIGNGFADSEAQAVEAAQEKATADRRKREAQRPSTKTVAPQ